MPKQRITIMKRSWRSLASASLAGLVLGLLLISCSSEKKASIYEELLKLVPDTSATRSEVYINDYALVRKLFDISLPGKNADEEDMIEYLLALNGPLEADNEDFHRLGPGPFISGFHEYGELLLERRLYLAFDLRDVEQSVLAGTPPGRLEIIRGQFDPQATEQALMRCTECPEPNLEEYRGASFYSWGKDLELSLTQRLVPPAFDHLGRGGRIAVQTKYVFRTVETPGMRALLKTSRDPEDSLINREEFKLLAKGLSRLEPFTVLLSNRTQAMDELVESLNETAASQGDMERLEKELRQSPLLRPYQAFATGQGKDMDGLYMALVLVHRDKESATENEALLRQRIRKASSMRTAMPWSEMVDDVEIEVDGQLLLAKLRGRIAISWAEWFWARDPLILHE